MARKLYEIEIYRSNVDPKQFFRYCKREMLKRTGYGLDGWVESYEDWSNPKYPCDSSYFHEDWDVPVREICKTLNFDMQMYLGKAYNFIMEFQFNADGKGFGYLYAVEFER